MEYVLMDLLKKCSICAYIFAKKIWKSTNLAKQTTTSFTWKIMEILN